MVVQSFGKLFFENEAFVESEIFLVQLDEMAGSSLCHSVEATVCCFMAFTDDGLFFFPVVV